MLDWISASFDMAINPNILQVPHTIKMGADGEVLADYQDWLPVPSHDTNICIRPVSPHPQLKSKYPIILGITGNPLKFIQGHNVAGTDDIDKLARKSLKIIEDKLKEYNPKQYDDFECSKYNDGNARATRLDFTLNFRFGDGCSEIHNILRHLSLYARSRNGTALTAGTTVYFQKKSTKWTLKFYCKYCELKKHPHKEQHIQDLLLNYTNGLLRCELTLRRPEIEKIPILKLKNDIVYTYLIDRITIPNRGDTMANINELSVQQSNVFRLWQLGEDVNNVPKNTYYRYRRAILDVTGCDISTPPPKQNDDDDIALTENDFKSVQEPDFPEELMQNNLIF